MTAFLTIMGEPRPKGRPRFSRRNGRAFTPTATRVAEESFAGRLAAEAKSAGIVEPLTGPLQVDLEFHLPIPASWSKKKHVAAALRNVLPTGRPDLDNFVKLATDAANGLLWLDDSQIVRLNAGKSYTDGPPHTRIIVKQLGGEP